jgi:serine/threonine-protein kinase
VNVDNHPAILKRPASSTEEQGRRPRTTALPPDLLEKSRGRVKLVALLILGAILLELVSDVPAEGPRALIGDLPAVASWGGILLSLVLYGFARSKRFKPGLVLNLGLLYQIALCMLISLILPWATHSAAIELGVEDLLTVFLPQTTWVTAIIIMFPLIIPSTPRKTLWIAIASALTVPLSLLIFEMSGVFDVEPRAYPRTFLDPAIAVVIAYFGSRVVYGMGIAVSRARQMGSYQLETKLGAGGMGEVWRARHRMLARPAAIKLVKPEVLGAADTESQNVMLHRFEREAQATAMLRSPHTIELYDFGVADDGTFYYVMELLDGFDLETLGQKYGPTPPERAIHVLRQMCHSLAEAHDNGLIHRDIKPANIYLCRYGREVDFTKVLDFGLVKARTEPGVADVKLTAENVAGGTPAYMAPEQVLDTSPVDARTDIYAVGCVAYWLLTGHLVFEGENVMQTMMHHAKTAPAPPSAQSEMEIPAGLDSLVLQCLEKDPQRRPQSTDKLAAMLLECRADVNWTQERARQWWDMHQPGASAASA